MEVHKWLCKQPRQDLPPHLTGKKDVLRSPIVQTILHNIALRPTEKAKEDARRRSRDSTTAALNYHPLGLHATRVETLLVSPSSTCQEVFKLLSAQMGEGMRFAGSDELEVTRPSEWVLKVVGGREFLYRTNTKIGSLEYVQEQLERAGWGDGMVLAMESADEQKSADRVTLGPESKSVDEKVGQRLLAKMAMSSEIEVPVYFVLLHKSWIGFNVPGNKLNRTVLTDLLFSSPRDYTVLDGLKHYFNQGGPTPDQEREALVGHRLLDFQEEEKRRASLTLTVPKQEGAEDKEEEEEMVQEPTFQALLQLRIDRSQRAPMRRASNALQALKAELTSLVGGGLGMEEVKKDDVSVRDDEEETRGNKSPITFDPDVGQSEVVGPLPWDEFRTCLDNLSERAEGGGAVDDLESVDSSALRDAECDPKDVGRPWGTFFRKEDVEWPLRIRLLGLSGLSRVLEDVSVGSHGEQIRTRREYNTIYGVRVEVCVCALGLL